MGWFDPIVDAAEDVGNGIVDGAEAVGGAIVDGAEAAWDAATGAAEDAGQAVGNGFSSMVDALGQAMEDAMQAAAKAAEDAAKAAAEAAEDAAKAMEQAVNDTYDWGRGAADTLATGVADAADWGIGAFETVGSGIAEGLRSIPEEVSDSVSTWVHENLSKYAEEAATTFASGIIAGIVGSGEETTDKPVADGQAPNAPLGPYTGEDESVGTVGQGLSIVEGDSDVFPNLPDGGVFDALRDAIEGLVGGKQPDLSDATPTVDEALVQTSASSAALADADTKDQSSSVGALLGADGGLGGLSLGDTAQPLGGLRDASDAGIIVVGGHEGPGEAFTDANPLLEGLSRIAGASFGAKPIVSAVGDISNEHRELARETLDGVELPNTSLRELADRELFNERPFELPGLDGPFGGRDLLGWLDGKGGYGGPNGLGGIPGGLGGDGGPGGFEGLPGWLGGRGGPGDLGGFPGGFGGPSGDGAPIGEGGFGGELGGFGGLPGWLTGDGNGGLDGLFGVGLGDRGSAGGFGGIDPGGAGGIDGLGIGLPPDLGGSRMPDIKLKGEDAMWHEEGNKVVADKGETLQVERGTKSFTVSEGKSFEKHEGDQFVSNKEPNTHYYVSDGKVEKVGGSNSGGTTNDKPHPGDPKGMPADGDSGGGPNWSPYAMPADDGSGGGPNWSPYAMPADDGSGGGPVWSTLMPADDSVGGGGPSWSLHDSSAVAVLADTQPATSGHQFASAFSAIEPHFSLDGVSALGSHMWF